MWLHYVRQECRVQCRRCLTAVNWSSERCRPSWTLFCRGRRWVATSAHVEHCADPSPTWSPFLLYDACWDRCSILLADPVSPTSRRCLLNTHWFSEECGIQNPNQATEGSDIPNCRVKLFLEQWQQFSCYHQWLAHVLAISKLGSRETIHYLRISNCSSALSIEILSLNSSSSIILKLGYVPNTR